MEDCMTDKQPRLRIEASGTGNYDWKIQSMDYGVAREICLRIAQYIRHREIFSTEQVRYVAIEDLQNPMISVEEYDLDDQKSVCAVVDLWTHAVQVAINGMSTLETLATLEDIAHIISLMRVPPQAIPEIQE